MKLSGLSNLFYLLEGTPFQDGPGQQAAYDQVCKEATVLSGDGSLMAFQRKRILLQTSDIPRLRISSVCSPIMAEW